MVVVLDPSPCCVVVLLFACPVVGSDVERVLLAWPVDGLTVEEFVVLWPSGFSVVVVLVVDWAKPVLPRATLIPNATAANLNADCIIPSRSIYQRTPRTPCQRRVYNRGEFSLEKSNPDSKAEIGKEYAQARSVN